MTEMAISPLRRRMIEDMTVRNFLEKTQQDYIRHVKKPHRLPRPIAGHGHGRGSAALPAASDRDRRPPADRSTARFRHCGSSSPSRVDRPDVTKPLTFVAEPRKIPVVLESRGGGALSGGGAWAKVQGGALRPPMARACACRRWYR